MLPGAAVNNIRRFRQGYLARMAGKEGRDSEVDRRRREETVRRILSEPEALDESRLLDLVSNLYSSKGRRMSKKQVVDRWISGAGGLDRLREDLRKLLQPGRRLAERFDAFRASVKDFGAATISEMLAYYNPR